MMKYFDAGRFYRVLKKNAFEVRKTGKLFLKLIAGLFVVTVMIQWLQLDRFFISFLKHVFTAIRIFYGDVEQYQQMLFILTLNILGIYLAIISFRPLYGKRTAALWIGYPATVIEKYLAQWLLSGPFFAAALLLAYSLLILLLNGFTNVLSAGSMNLFPLWDPAVLKNVLSFLALQNLFITGSVCFRRHPFLKSAAVFLFLLLMLFTVYTGSAWLMAGGKVVGITGLREMFLQLATGFSALDESLVLKIQRLSGIIDLSEYLLLLPGCWLLAVCKLKNTEGYYGV